MTTAIFGRPSDESLASFDRASCLWKRSQGSLFPEDSDGRYPILLVPGLMRSGSIYPLRTSGLPTGGGDCSLWPTPQCQDHRHSPANAENRKASGRQIHLAHAVHWPTPTVNGNYNRAGLSDRSGDGLATAVNKWPTPRASDSERGGRGELLHMAKGSETPRGPLPSDAPTSDADTNDPPMMTEADALFTFFGETTPSDATAELLWPTPQARDWKSGNVSANTQAKNSRPLSEAVWATPTSHPRTHTPRQVDHGAQLANQVGGTLNPTWVEWLMGFPLGWTDLEPSATP